MIFFFLFLCFFSFFFLVIILLSFRRKLFLLGQMTLQLSCDRELSKALQTSQAADLFNQPSEFCDQIFNSMTNNVINCEYKDIYDKTLNLQNDSYSMIPMHRYFCNSFKKIQKRLDLFKKTTMTCTTLLPRFLFDRVLFVYLNLALISV